MRGTLVPFVFLHGFINTLQLQGWGWLSNFRGFRWLWVLCIVGIWVIVWGGGDGFQIKTDLWIFLETGKTTCNYFGPHQQWGLTTMRKHTLHY